MSSSNKTGPFLVRNDEAARLLFVACDRDRDGFITRYVINYLHLLLFNFSLYLTTTTFSCYTLFHISLLFILSVFLNSPDFGDKANLSKHELEG